MKNIKFYIDRWLSVRSNRTLSSLSRATDVPLSTIRRLYSGDGGLADSKSMLPLLAAVCDVSEMSNFVDQHYPEVSRFYEILASGDEKELKPDVLERSIYDTREAYFTYSLSLARLATEKRIESLFGAYGLQTADELVQLGLLTKKGDEYVPTDGRTFVYQGHHLANLKQIQHVISVVNPNKKHDTLFTGVFSTNDEGRAEIEALTKAYFEKIIEIAKRDVPSVHVVAMGLSYARVIDESSDAKQETCN